MRARVPLKPPYCPQSQREGDVSSIGHILPVVCMCTNMTSLLTGWRLQLIPSCDPLRGAEPKMTSQSSTLSEGEVLEPSAPVMRPRLHSRGHGNRPKGCSLTWCGVSPWPLRERVQGSGWRPCRSRERGPRLFRRRWPPTDDLCLPRQSRFWVRLPWYHGARQLRCSPLRLPLSSPPVIPHSPDWRSELTLDASTDSWL